MLSPLSPQNLLRTIALPSLLDKTMPLQAKSSLQVPPFHPGANQSNPYKKILNNDYISYLFKFFIQFNLFQN